jgi:hypothetical protein
MRTGDLDRCQTLLLGLDALRVKLSTSLDQKELQETIAQIREEFTKIDATWHDVAGGELHLAGTGTHRGMSRG